MNDPFNIAIMIPVLHYIMGGLQIDPESLVGELPVSMVLTVSVVHNYWVVLSLVMSGNSVAAYLFQVMTASGAKGGGILLLLHHTLTQDQRQRRQNLRSWVAQGTSLLKKLLSTIRRRTFGSSLTGKF